MVISLKYAHVERERRYRLSEVPEGVASTRQLVDRYLVGTRLRLREVTENCVVTRKLTDFYLDDGEWNVLEQLPATILRKTRHVMERDGLRVAVDAFADGTIIAEIDDGESPSDLVPDWLSVLKDVSDDEEWTG